MQLKSIRFEAFKSLYDVQCDLDPLTVITGPNGSGKSNLVDGMNFVGEIYTHGLEFAVARAGGFENIAHRRSRRAKKPIAVHIEAELGAKDLRLHWGRQLSDKGKPTGLPRAKALIYKHSFSLKTAGQRALSDFQIERDEVQLLDATGRPLYRLFRDGDESRIWVDTDLETVEATFVRNMMGPYLPDGQFGRAPQPLASTELLTEQSKYLRPFWGVNAGLRGIRVFQLSPHQVRGSGVSTPNASLERHGENLPGAADHLRRNDPKAWSQIESAMRAIMPGLEEIKIAFTEDRRLALQFSEHAVGRPWNSNEVSDGTIQALALFVALFDSRSPLLAIEEPENSLHPWILRQFLDLCRAAKTKQIVMTSHSPVLLDYVDPSVIRLLSMDGGRSLIRRFSELSPEIAELVLAGEITAFEGYDSGAIPESVPHGYRQIEESE